MQDDPGQYWQDLTANYRQMSDGELLQLAEKPEELTEVAQQALRDELKLRRLETQQRPTAFRSTPDFNPSTHFDFAGGVFRSEYAPPPEDLEEGLPAEYTWKTLLCDCESNDRAWQLFEALKRHGIESWVRQVHPSSTDVLGPQVYVAADQLEEAKAVASQPIPQDIIDDWNAVVPEFQLPICPRCGSREDVILESADPVNTWSCETCGAEWSDVEPASAEDADEERSSAS
jgi:hypothetical protein